MAVNSSAVTLNQNANEGHNRKNDLAFSSFIKHQLEMMNITHTKRSHVVCDRSARCGKQRCQFVFIMIVIISVRHTVWLPDGNCAF